MVDTKLDAELDQLRRQNEELRAELATYRQLAGEQQTNEWRFRRLSESGVIGIATFDLLGNIRDANDAFLNMIGFNREVLRAGEVRWSQLTPPEWMPRTRQALEELRTRGWCTPYEKEYFRRDGSRFWGLFGGAMRHDRSEGVAFVLDITPQKELEQAERKASQEADAAAARTRSLQRLTAALSQALTPAEVGPIVLNEGLSILGAQAGSISLLRDTGQIEVVFDSGYDPEAVRQWSSFSLTASVPIAEAIRTGRPIFLLSRQEFTERYPSIVPSSQTAAWAAVPLLVEERVIGALGLSFEQPAKLLDQTGRDFSLTLAQLCAQAIERSRLYEAERTARLAAEAGRQRLAFLAEAGIALASSLEERATLKKIAELIVPRVADGCLLELLREDGRLEQVALITPDSDHVALFTELERRYPRQLSGSGATAHVVQSGQGQLWSHITNAELEAAAQDPEHLRLLRRFQLDSLMIVPLILDHELLGVLTLITAGSGRHLSQADLVMAEALASRAALALHNARLFRQTTQLNQELEERVQQRTAQLQSVNALLEEEITERRHTEIMAREQERLYRTLARNIPNGTVILLNKELHYVLAEGELMERLGLSQIAYAGKHVRHVLPPADAAERIPHYQKALAGTPDTAEINFRGRTYLSHAVPVYDDKSQIEGILVLIHDIEELTQARLQVEQRANQLAALAAMGQMVTSTLDLTAVLQRVLDHISRFVPAEAVSILLLDEDELHVAAANGRATPLQGKRLPDTIGVATEALQNGRPVCLQANQEFEYLARNGEQVESYLVRTVAAVPLKLQDSAIGVIEAVHSEATRFTDEHLQWLEAAANWTAIAVSNARLFEEASLNRARLEGLTQQLVSAQEEERKRIARELHDEAGQAMTALKIMLSLLRQSLPPEAETAQQDVNAAIELTEQTMEQIRLLSHDLHPPAFETVGLNNVLEAFCQEFAGRTQLAISYTGRELPSLSRLVNISLYRLLQETLTNAVKHAQASHIRVLLGYDGRFIRLAISDNGQGFDLETRMVVSGQPGGIGLLGMQERFRLLDGWVEIASRPGQGTQVVGVVPWKQVKLPYPT
jgi:PAS domain S-box-containing protein